MEEKSFIIYNHVLLVLLNNNEIMMVTADEIDRRRPIVLRKGEDPTCRLLNETSFLIYDQSRDIELLTANAEEWVAALSKVA